MTAVLHRLGYVYKKPRLIPGKTDREAQERFLEAYDEIEKNKGKDDPIYFMDADPSAAQSGAGRRLDQARGRAGNPLPTNTGWRHVNINGAIDLERLESVVRFDDTINADSTIALFKQLEAIHLTTVCL